MTPTSITPFIKLSRVPFDGSTKVDELNMSIISKPSADQIKAIKEIISKSGIINKVIPHSYHLFTHLTDGNEETAKVMIFCAAKITENDKPIFNMSNEGGQFIITQNRTINPTEWDLKIQGPTEEMVKPAAKPEKSVPAAAAKPAAKPAVKPVAKQDPKKTDVKKGETKKEVAVPVMEAKTEAPVLDENKITDVSAPAPDAPAPDAPATEEKK